MSFWSDARRLRRFVWELGAYLREPLTPAECRARVEAQMRGRADAFLGILERAVYANPRSPYRALLEHARIDFAAASRRVRADGVERALGTFYDAGVHVSIDEFKGRRPIERPGLRLPTVETDFDNALAAGHYEGRTGGSRGAGTRLVIDLDVLAHESADVYFFHEAHAMAGRPIALWRPVPPGVAGMKNVLRLAKLGTPAERWFCQNEPGLHRGSLKHALFTEAAIVASRAWGKPLARPEHVPLARPDRVLDWLVEKSAAGRPAVLDTSVSCAIRIAGLAAERGAAIGGTLFRIGGEPLTPSRAEIIARAGCRWACYYSASEVGHLGLACADPTAVDDVHVLTDKMAVIQRSRRHGDASPVDALFWTTLLPSTPKVMLNVETGDAAILSERACGCALGAAGFHAHLHTVRSYEKLTTEGMHFLGSEILVLVDSVLPGKFGGVPTDYQFVEEERDGLRTVSLVVSPRVGAVDEAVLVATVLETLGAFPGGTRMMADYWRDGRTVRVVRREPHATSAAKVQPLHVVRND